MDAKQALLLMDMQRALSWMEYTTALAEREERLGGWLSDHGSVMNDFDAEYMKARNELENILKGE